MAMYQRVQTPKSPLLPLSPMLSISPSMYLSPYTTSIRSRRSFTPYHLNKLPPPPSLSPIQSGFLSNKSQGKRDNFTSMTPEQLANLSLLVAASHKKSMKKVRSSVRSIERTQHMPVPLESIRRSLFAEESPLDNALDTLNASRLIAPQTIRENVTPKRLLTPNQRSQFIQKIPSPGLRDEYIPTTGILEETFTVISILKEIKMEKYIGLFVDEEVDLFVFLILTVNDMIELGIDKNDIPILKNAIECYTEFFSNPEKMFFS